MPKEEKSPPPFEEHFAASVIATGIAHVTRVMMNRAANHTSIVAVLKDSAKHLHTGLGLNSARGVTAVTLQSWTKSQIHAVYGNNTMLGVFASLVGASAAGALVNSFAETPFIRKSTLKIEHAGLNLAFTRFSAPLSMLYLIREFGFSVAVLGAKDLPTYLYWPAFVGAAAVSGACHKLATWEATTDMAAALNQTAPNFKRDGVKKTLLNLAHGNVYTLDACRVRFPNPVTNWQLARNLIGITCPPTMIVYRMVFLKTFEYGYSVGLRLAPKVCDAVLPSVYGFFGMGKEKAAVTEVLECERKLRR